MLVCECSLPPTVSDENDEVERAEVAKLLRYWMGPSEPDPNAHPQFQSLQNWIKTKDPPFRTPEAKRSEVEWFVKHPKHGVKSADKV